MASRLLALRTPLVASFLPVSRGHHLISNRTRPHITLQRTLRHHFSTGPGKGESSHGVQEIPQDQYNQRATEPKSIETMDMNQVLLEVVNGQRKRQDMQDEKYKLLLQDYTRLQHEHKWLLQEKRELEGRLHLRSALELIAHKAINLGILTGHVTKCGVTQRLEALASTNEFQAIIEEEAEDRGLVAKDLCSQVSHIYHELSKWIHNANSPILLGRSGFTRNERAVLACFLRLQESWRVPLEWDEEEGEEQQEEYCRDV